MRHNQRPRRTQGSTLRSTEQRAANRSLALCVRMCVPIDLLSPTRRGKRGRGTSCSGPVRATITEHCDSKGPGTPLPPQTSTSLDLLSEGAALGQPRLATGRLAEHSGATAADDDSLGVAEHRRAASASAQGGTSAIDRGGLGEWGVGGPYAAPAGGSKSLGPRGGGGRRCARAQAWRATGAARWCERGSGAHVEATRALHVHEEGVGRRHEALQLVATELELLRRMQQVNVTHGNVRLQAREQPERAQRSAQRAMRASAERSGATGSLPAEHIACAACLAVLGWLGAPPRGDEHAAATGAAAADRGASAERGQTAHHS